MLSRSRLLVRRRLLSTYTPPAIQGTIPRGGKGIAVNDYAEVKRTFSEHDVLQFGSLVGDRNPLHESVSVEQVPCREALEAAGVVQWDDKCQTKPLVHGMLASSLFSSIFGTLIPGSVYRSQSLTFRRPVFAQDSIVGRVDVMKVRSAPNGGVLVVCDTKVTTEKDGNVCITGEAKVWLPEGTIAS